MSAPYKYDIVGSFLRDKEIKQAREEFALGKITLQQLEEVENKSIENLVNEEKTAGLKAVTDGEFRRAFWHLDFLWDLKGVEKVAVEHFSIAFKGHQPKSQTLEIVDKIDFPEDHPFLKHFKFMQRVSGETEVKQCIPSPSMLHLICCIREENYQPIERYQDNDVLLKDIAYAYQKAIKAFYNAGCRYLQLDDTSWGEFCSKEKREAYKARGIDVDELAKKYVDMINLALEAKPDDMVITMHICRGNFRSTWFTSGGYEPVAKILFGKNTATYEYKEEDRHTATDSLYARLIALVDAGKINEAENRLYEELERDEEGTFEVAIGFYDYLNELPEEFLEEHDYSKEEVKEGAQSLADRKGLGLLGEGLD